MKHLSALLLCLLLLTPAAAQSLTPSQMREDLNKMADLIRRCHPDPFHAASEAEFDQLLARLRDRCDRQIELNEFFFILMELAYLLKDPHTTVQKKYDGPFLGIRLVWAHDGLVVSWADESCGLKSGDKILSVGGLNPVDLEELLISVIPAENRYWVRSMAEDMLVWGAFLEYLGLARENKVALVVEDGLGKVLSLDVPMRTSPLSEDLETNRIPVGWSIDNEASLGVFYLDEHRGTEAIRVPLEAFFRAVRDNRIRRIAIDVREKRGGISDYYEFLRYLPVHRSGWFSYFSPRVRGFSVLIRYSPEATDQLNYSKESGFWRYNPLEQWFTFGWYAHPPDPDLVFYGDVFILTTNNTFSAASNYPIFFQDNNLAKVIGEPPGQAPSQFSDTLRFTLPNSRISLIVSHKHFTRPAPERDPADFLYPDVFIPRTVQDIRLGRDAVMEWLLAPGANHEHRSADRLKDIDGRIR